MRTANRNDILALKLRIVPVKIPGVKLRVYIREMNVEQREAYIEAVQAALADKEVKKDIASRTLLPSIVDKHGNRLFTDDEAAKLADVNPQAITAMTTKMLEISGLFPEVLEAEKKD